MAAQAKSGGPFGDRRKIKKINLLPQEEFAASTLGRILAWALSTFRVIVVITEMVIMGAFLSRFWLDAKSADLSEEIKQKQSIILSSKEFEDEFRKIQKKLNVVSSLSKETKYSQVLSEATPALPQNIFLDSVSVAEGQIKIKGTSPDERSIAQFIANLNSFGTYEDVSLTQLDIKDGGESFLIFGITATF